MCERCTDGGLACCIVPARPRRLPQIIMNLNAVGRVRLRLGQACLHASWAGGPELGALLRRVFAIDLEQCPKCGGELKSIAVFSSRR
jgi:hypothetical protein